VSLTRRAWISAAAALPMVQSARAADLVAAPAMSTALPARAAFAAMSTTYLNAGSVHPFSLGAAKAVQDFAAERTLAQGEPRWSLDATDERIRKAFAALVKVSPDELCLVQSTTSGEQLVTQALGLPRKGARVVSDTLHFFGSFYLYEAFARAGVEVHWVKPRDGRSIDYADLEAAVTPGTTLVAVSAVSTINGFEHDLKRVSEIAHAKGALVYADIIHAAGAVPLDLAASGVDFAACSGYKWLMGDFGLGFLYARRESMQRLKRSQFGYEQLQSFATHVYPFDAPGGEVADYAPRDDATGFFATGTTSGSAAAQLAYSLDYISALGVEAIQRHRQPLLDHARRVLERRGHACITPEGSRSPLLAFAYEGAAERLAPKLDAAKVTITLSKNRFRISPSVFNDLADIDRLLAALA